MLKSFLKSVLYIAFLVALAIYTPRIMSDVLNTPFPMAAVTSGSMWPVLKTGDLVFMRGISGNEAQVGQIIVYQNERGFTIHRLIEKKDGKLITKGDANSISDSPISPDEVVGRAVYFGDKPLRIPKVGILAQAINGQKN